MKLKSRIIGSSMVLALALGMSAGSSFGVNASNPPVAATGQTAFPQGTQVSRGSCSGILIGSLSDPTKLLGLGNVLRDITSSSKGVPGSAADAAVLPYPTVGSCLIDGRVGLTGGTGGVNQAKTIIKAGTKLHSSGTRCGNDANGNGIPFEPAALITPPTYSFGIMTAQGTGGDLELNQRALSGKFSYAFSDGSKMDTYIRVQGFDTGFADVIWLTGIVTKGEAVGATIGGNVWFNPVYKNKLATTYLATLGDLTTGSDSFFVTAATSTLGVVTATVAGGSAVPVTANIVVGQSVTVSGLAGTGGGAAGVNGTFMVTAKTPTSISYTATPNSGAITDGLGSALGVAIPYNFPDGVNGASLSYAPGYAGSTSYSTTKALGCLAQSIEMNPGLTNVAIGGGSLDPLLGGTTAGVQFLL